MNPRGLVAACAVIDGFMAFSHSIRYAIFGGTENLLWLLGWTVLCAAAVYQLAQRP